jgi:hypothetical protein
MAEKLTLTTRKMAPIMFVERVLEDILGKRVVIMQCDIFHGVRFSILQQDIKGRLYGGTSFHAAMPHDVGSYFRPSKAGDTFTIHIVVEGEKKIFAAYNYDCLMQEDGEIVVRCEGTVEIAYWLAYKPSPMSQDKLYRAVQPIWPDWYTNFYVDIDHIEEGMKGGSIMNAVTLVCINNLRGDSLDDPSVLQLIPDGPVEPFRGIIYKLFTQLEDAFAWMDQN